MFKIVKLLKIITDPDAGDIGVGDELPKGVKFIELDSPSVYRSKKMLELKKLIKKQVD